MVVGKRVWSTFVVMFLPGVPTLPNGEVIQSNPVSGGQCCLVNFKVRTLNPLTRHTRFRSYPCHTVLASLCVFKFNCASAAPFLSHGHAPLSRHQATSLSIKLATVLPPLSTPVHNSSSITGVIAYCIFPPSSSLVYFKPAISLSVPLIKQSHCYSSTASIMAATSGAPSLSRPIYVALPSQSMTNTCQLQMWMKHMFKCSRSAIYAHTFASLSLGGLMQARQPSLRRFVV